MDVWGGEGFTVIYREFSLSLSCRWLEEDVATSEPGQREQDTNLKPPSSKSVLWGQAVISLSLTGVKKPTRKPQFPISAGILPSLLLGVLCLSLLMTQDLLSQPEQCVGSCSAREQHSRVGAPELSSVLVFRDSQHDHHPDPAEGHCQLQQRR